MNHKTDRRTDRNGISLWASGVWGLFVSISLLSCFCTSAHAQNVQMNVRSWTALENLLTGMIAVDDETLLVLENDSGQLSRIQLSSSGGIQFIQQVESGLIDPVSILPLRDGSLAIAERNAGRILRLQDGEREVILDGLGELSSLRSDPIGMILAVELDGGRILRVNPLNGEAQVVTEGHNFPSDVLVVNSNSFVITELFDRQTYLGQIVRSPLNPFQPSTSPEWKTQTGIIDPTRLLRNPFNPSQVLVSLRFLEFSITFPTGPVGDGGVIFVDLESGLRQGTMIDGLQGPTDLTATSDSLFILEERSERISRVTEDGDLDILWDGLGEPSAFAYNPLRRVFLAAETSPGSALIRITPRSMTLERELPEDIHVTGIVSGVTTYLSVLSRGEIHEVLSPTETRILSNVIQAPDKLIAGQDNSLWVNDRIHGSIYRISTDSGEIIESIPPPLNSFIFDYDVTQDELGAELLYAMDNQGVIHQYNRSTGNRSGRFQSIAVFSPDDIVIDGLALSPVFKAMGEEGFLVAANDEQGALYWLKPDGDTQLLDTGYWNCVQFIEMNFRNSFAVMSRNGWIRSGTITFQDDDFPTPTITPTPTVGIPQRPTPTPTPPFTSVSDWLIHPGE